MDKKNKIVALLTEIVLEVMLGLSQVVALPPNRTFCTAECPTGLEQDPSTSCTGNNCEMPCTGYILCLWGGVVVSTVPCTCQSGNPR